MPAWRLPKSLTQLPPRTISIALYAAGLAAGAFLLQWLQYQYLARVFAPEFYVVLIALAFTALGVWAGQRLTPKVAPQPFLRNDAAANALGLTDRESQILELLAQGHANKEIARTLDVSPNTVKTHIANLFTKLEVERRTQAIQKARELRLLP
jgi:DNA-binding CsgD family transcriptional regulator